VLKMMRKNTTARNVIIVIVVIALAGYMLVGLGEAPVVAQGDTIAKVGSTRIKLRDVYVYQERTRQNAQRMGFANQMQPEQLDAMTAQTLVESAVLLDGAERADISVSKDELRDTVIQMRTDPDGGFVNDDTWARYINFTYRQRVPTFEEYLREHALKIDKFQRLFTASIYVSEQDIEERFAANNKKVKLEMLTLNTFDVRSEVNMGDDEQLKKFFEENPEDFVTGDLRQIQYVTFPINDYREQVSVSDEEIEAFYQQNISRYTSEQVNASHILIKTENRSEEEARKEIDRIRTEIEGGLSFFEAAQKYSEDEPSKVNGGDLGWFPRNRMVPEFGNAVFAMNAGEISQPVKTQYGFHLIQKHDHNPNYTTPLEEAKTSIANVLFRQNAKVYAMELAAKLHEALSAEDADFAETAKELGYQVRTSRFFDNDNRSNLGDPLQQSFQTRSAVFNLSELNQITEPIDAGVQIVVAQWIAEKEPQPLDFEEDKNRIRNQAEKIAAQRYIRDFFESFRVKAAENPEKSFQELRGDQAFLKDNHFKETDWVSAANIPWEINRPSLNFEEDIYALSAGEFLASIESASDTRFVLARVVDKLEPDMDKLDEERIQIADELRQEIGLTLMSSWINSRNKDLDPGNTAYQRVLNVVSR